MALPMVNCPVPSPFGVAAHQVLTARTHDVTEMTMRDIEDTDDGFIVIAHPSPPPRVTPRWLAWLERFSR